MKKAIIFLLILSFTIISFAQDEFALEGIYTPQFFSELLDAELYSPTELYIVGVGGFIFVDISNISNPNYIGR